MYFIKEKLCQIAAESEELIQKYQNGYYDCKTAVDTSAEYKVIWTQNIAEPYYIGYLNDLEAFPERKICKSEPKKKAYCAKHYFSGDEPVYSVFFNGKAEPCMEKFFIRSKNARIGVMYVMDAKGKPCRISAEIFDEDDKPVEYRCIEIREQFHQPSEINIECFVYTYEDTHIISAECIRDLNISKPIMMYDDPLYKDWEKRDINYKLGTPPMNPNSVDRYDFIYGGTGSPTAYSRTGYSYCHSGTHQFKAKNLFDRLVEYGILWFTKT